MSRIYFSFAFLILAFPCSASTITVDNDGPADFNNIQAAINSAINGDTIIVQPGTYTGNGNRNISFNGKRITVRSIDPCDPCVIAATVINCEGVDGEVRRGFSFTGGETSQTIMEGVTITGGYADGQWPSCNGGAIYCSSAPTIRRCRIIGNRAGQHGGGILLG